MKPVEPQCFTLRPHITSVACQKQARWQRTSVIDHARCQRAVCGDMALLPTTYLDRTSVIRPCSLPTSCVVWYTVVLMQVLANLFPHLKFPKYVSFAACDTCVFLKDRVRLCQHPAAKETWQKMLEAHRTENDADRRMYMNNAYGRFPSTHSRCQRALVSVTS